MNEFRRHEATLQGGFAMAIYSTAMPRPASALRRSWPLMKTKIAAIRLNSAIVVVPFNWETHRLHSGRRAGWTITALILVGMPLAAEVFRDRKTNGGQPAALSGALAANASWCAALTWSLLLLLTVLVLFATTWLALFLSKLVTRPVVALAEATAGNFSRTTGLSRRSHAADEIGDLVRSFNRMAEELEGSRRQIESSSRELSAANMALEQRRQHIETILESIPTGVLSLDASRRVTHVNHALHPLFNPTGPDSGQSES